VLGKHAARAGCYRQAWNSRICGINDHEDEFVARRRTRQAAVMFEGERQ